jgi:large subunit ribosomal protein L24
MKLHIKKGDTVKVIAGDEKGKVAKVTVIDTKANKAILEGINMVSRAIKPSTQNPQGGLIKKEAPIHISNLMLVDKKGVASKIGRKLVDGKIVRFSKKSNEIIK